MINSIHPGLILILSGIVIMLVPEKLRKVLMIAGPVIAAFAAWSLNQASCLCLEIVPKITLQLLHVDSLTKMFLVIFSAASLIGAVYALSSKNRFETGLEAIYAGSSMGAVLAGDWITLIIFWEIMAVSSWLIVTSAGTERASKAGFRYLMVHLLGGNLLLAGIIMKVAGGSMDITCLTGTGDAAFWLIFLGVAVNAAIPPLNSWVSDAYPEAPMGGTVYMASFTTKVGMFYIIRLFAGTEFLLWVGVFMAIYGASMALIENDLRRLFSYHIVSQLGYIVAAAAVGGALGIDGAAAHTFNNILYKGVLFMCCGAVITATGKRRISDLSGLYRKMPLTSICFLIASLSIAGFPLLNGFVSKSLIMNAMVEGGYHGAEILLMAASVGTLLSIALKVNYFVFFGKADGCTERNTVLEVKPVPLNMKIAMVMGTAGCVIIGVMPDLLYGLTPFGSDGHPFTVDHVTQYIELFAAATLAFVMYIRHMAPHVAITLDFDWFYRKPLAAAVRWTSGAVSGLFETCGRLVSRLVAAGSRYLHRPSAMLEDLGVKIPRRKGGIEDDDVLMKPAGSLVAINVTLGIVIAAVVLAILKVRGAV
ncbi:MAG: Na(+)/H(+) antiporter subunit D [Firmicutes bacterium]|nr:Na(+)/H(+) antiporter subunit D [Bacillota bacterium]